MNVKYQIFVSSTYEDLKKERDQVVKAILEMGHIPVGMEMFSAADEEQWKIIARYIAESDYYVVIVAHRYGTLDGSISYTEKEYDYAVKCGIPTLGFVIDDTASWPTSYVDSDAECIAALGNFKEKVRRKLVSFWNSADDLHGKIAIALNKQMSVNPRTGWVRASESLAPEMATELTRLSSENGELRRRLSEASAQNLRQEDEWRERTAKLLTDNQFAPAIWYQTGRSQPGKSVSLLTTFDLCARYWITSRSPSYISKLLGYYLRTSDSPVRDSWPIAANTVHGLIADFTALGLLETHGLGHSLSSRGKEFDAYVRLARLASNSTTRPSVDLEMRTLSPEHPSAHRPIAKRKKRT